MVQSSKVVRSSRRTPCPVCGRVKDGDCRMLSDGLVLCHQTTEHRAGEVVRGKDGLFWAFTGVSSDGRCGVFKPDEPREAAGPPPTPGRIEPQPSRAEQTFWHYGPSQRVSRVNEPDGKKRFVPEHLAGSRWRPGGGPERWPFYGRLAESGAVFELEGEKCVDIMLSLGYGAITHPGHNRTKEANQARYEGIRDRVTHVIYIADNDAAGKKNAELCKEAATAASVPFIALHAGDLWPGIKETGSVDDVAPEQILPAITAALTEPQATAPTSSDAPAIDQARIRLKELISNGLSGSALATKIVELSVEYDCHAAALSKIALEVQSEDDAGLQADAEMEGIHRAWVLEKERERFTLEQLVPAQCVEPLRYLSTSLQVDDLATAMIFLTCASAAVRAGTRIWGDQSTFAERPQIWLGLVGKSGLGKSPAMRNLGITPTHLVRRRYHQMNEDRLLTWQLSDPETRGPEPQPFVFQISNYTAGAIVKQFAVNEEQRLGMLLACDELASLFTTLNEFQAKGRGGDQEQLLSLFDNNGDAQIRVRDGYRSYEEAHMSIIGGIQPLVFDNLASQGDPAGLFARLLLLPLPTDYRGDNLPPSYSKEATHNHQATLEELVLRIVDLPPTGYQLSPEAEQYHRAVRRDAHHDADRATLPAHSNIHGKRAGYVLRIAGIMHILRVTAGEVDPDQTQAITLETVRLADRLTQHLQAYALSAQTRAAMAAEGSITELMRWIHRYALDKETSPGRFRADALSPAKRKLYSIQAITQYVDRLVEAGLAEWLQPGSRNGGRRFRCRGRLPG